MAYNNQMGEKQDRYPFADLPGIERTQSADDIKGNPMSYKPYKETYRALAERLVVGYPVPDDVEVELIGNNTLLETTFRLRDPDKAVLSGVANPGKSAHIVHTRHIGVACLTMIGRPAKREDYLYIVPAAKLREIGFSAFYVPTKQHPLHVRIVPHRLVNGDIAQEDRQRLVEFLQPYQVQDPLRRAAGQAN